jgi:putative copper resistance protein D
MMTIGIWDAAMVTAKAATYAATLAASGGVFFLLYSRALLDGICAGRIRRLIRLLVLIAALAGGVMILVTGASMSGDAGGLVDVGLARMILQAGEGRASLVRLIGLILIGGSLAGRRSPAAMTLLGAVAAATSFAWVGHVHALSALRGAWLPVLVIALHLLGVAFWLGALIPLLMVAGDADADLSRGDTSRAGMSRIAATVGRFGTAALVVVGALLTAGVVLLCLLLRDVSEFWSDDYGRLVLTKILLVACLLALAALNHWRLTPRLFAYDTGALQALKRSIMAELTLAGCILVMTAAMTTLAGPSVLDMSH